MPDPCEPGWALYEDPPPHVDPCEKVASLKTDNTFKGAVNDLKSKTVENKEYAYYYGVNGYLPPVNPGTPGACEVKAVMNTAAVLKSYMHSHNNSCPLPIFSPDDLQVLGQLYYLNKDTYNFGLLDSTFSITLVTNTATYLLVIDNNSLFEDLYDDYLKEDGDNTLKDLSRLYNIYKLDKRSRPDSGIELDFLSLLKNITGAEGSGIKLLKANSDLSGYHVLNLNRAGNAVILTPCN